MEPDDGLHSRAVAVNFCLLIDSNAMPTVHTVVLFSVRQWMQSDCTLRGHASNSRPSMLPMQRRSAFAAWCEHHRTLILQLHSEIGHGRNKVEAVVVVSSLIWRHLAETSDIHSLWHSHGYL